MQMKKFKLILLILVIPAVLVSCKKTGSDTCKNGTLYYTPLCATIKGYIILDNNGGSKVFRHNIDAQYQQVAGTRVCITYVLDGPVALTADCTGGEVIVLTSIKSE